MWLLDPAQPAALAEHVVHGEREVAVEVGGPLPPTGPLGRDGVLPRRRQPGYSRPPGTPPEPTAAEPLHQFPPGFPARGPADLIGHAGQAPRRSRVRKLRAGLVVAVHAAVPISQLRHMIYAYPTFHRAIEDALRIDGPDAKKWNVCAVPIEALLQQAQLHPVGQIPALDKLPHGVRGEQHMVWA
ncbi:hypothetical protein E1193_23730 [Micromonospora sp. KC606]|nr:hypothetical protein E1193_23730 [Micromonospora sp. KC606]